MFVPCYHIAAVLLLQHGKIDKLLTAFLKSHPAGRFRTAENGHLSKRFSAGRRRAFRLMSPDVSGFQRLLHTLRAN
jgi:hypothetical protein